MPSLPVATSDSASPFPLRVATLSQQQSAVLAALLAALGLTSIWPTVLYLWSLWTTDALKSIGMVIPLVSGVLIFRAWRGLNYEMRGSWWGAFILVVTIAAVLVREQAVLVFILAPQWSIYIPPHSLVAFAYTAGVVLLFGGPRLFRAALFPIVLMWFVNPIPHIFNVLVDLPLQRISAHVARAFAVSLGQPLSPDQMRLMFTPDFGMFIAPGCNGIRGAVTMGFIALIAGYIYRFRWFANAAVVAGAILLGYVFNFARLCTLILYYIVALHFPWLRSRAEMGDYIIGACLFLIATVLLFSVIARLRQSPTQTLAAQPAPTSLRSSSSLTLPSIYMRLAFLAVVAFFGCYGVAHATERNRQLAAAQTDSNALGQFPQKIGDYTLVRSWNENLITGPLIFHWADYAPANGGPHVSIGISPVLGSHDTMICHSARGEDPLWHDQLTLPTAGQPISFSASFYNDGVTQFIEATTLCTGTACGEYSSPATHFGFVYSRPDTHSVFLQDPVRPIPILLRAETIETAILPDVARDQMSAAIRSFAASVNLNSLTQPYRGS
jgi:exosortase J